MSDATNPLLRGGLHLVSTQRACTLHNGDTSGNVDGEKVAEIRAWGYLTGRGSLQLSGEDAIRHQDALGRLFVAAPALLNAVLASQSVALHQRGCASCQLRVPCLPCDALLSEEASWRCEALRQVIAPPAPLLTATLADDASPEAIQAFGDMVDLAVQAMDRGEIGQPVPNSQSVELLTGMLERGEVREWFCQPEQDGEE